MPKEAEDEANRPSSSSKAEHAAAISETEWEVVQISEQSNDAHSTSNAGGSNAIEAITLGDDQKEIYGNVKCDTIADTVDKENDALESSDDVKAPKVIFYYTQTDDVAYAENASFASDGEIPETAPNTPTGDSA